MIGTGAELLAALADHVPVDVREATSLRRLRAMLRWLPDPFDEASDPAHVTAAGIVVDEDGRLLLHRHKRLGRWLQPGGHVDRRETLLVAALREVREETGLAATPLGESPLHVDVHEGPRGHLHLDVRFLLRADGAAAFAPGAGESQAIRWFSITEAEPLVDEGLRGALERLRRPRTHQTAR